MKNLFKLSIIVLTLTAFVACSNDDDDIEPKATATVSSSISSSTGNFNGDVTGIGGDASKTFTWKNAEATADYNMDITSGKSGSFRFMMKDVNGTIVLVKTLTGGTSPDYSFSGTTNAGTAGDWTVTLTLINFSGDGSYSETSGN